MSVCRFCSHSLQHTFAAIGMSPIANDYPSQEQLNRAEKFYPLQTYVCAQCLLVQLEEFESPDHIFGDGDYAYFSSYSDSWLQHAKAYTECMISSYCTKFVRIADHGSEKVYGVNHEMAFWRWPHYCSVIQGLHFQSHCLSLDSLLNSS